MLQTMVSMAAASLRTSKRPGGGGGATSSMTAGGATDGAAMEARLLSTPHFISQVSTNSYKHFLSL